MNLKKIGYSFFLLFLLVFNCIAILTIKKQNRSNRELINKYQLKCEDEDIEISVLKNYMTFQGVELHIDDSIKSKFSRHTRIPLLLIKEDVCGTCMDNLLLELEKMRSDSIRIIIDMTVAIITNGKNLQEKRIIPILRNKNIPVVLLDIRKNPIQKIKLLPDMSFTLIDEGMKIRSLCEYPVKYPKIFTIVLNEFNKSYIDIIKSTSYPMRN